MESEDAVDHDVTEDREPAETVAGTIAALIRRSSESGRLISGYDLCRQVVDSRGGSRRSQESGELLPAERVALSREGETKGATILAEALGQFEELRELSGDDGTRWYYSSTAMTGSYAVLLLRKQYDLTRLIVDVVRQNSLDYPRPVPVEAFTRPPFDLTGEQVSGCLENIGTHEEYGDIAFTVTSASTTFLYSTLYLEEDYASMLAEWFDVGQGENP